MKAQESSKTGHARGHMRGILFSLAFGIVLPLVGLAANTNEVQLASSRLFGREYACVASEQRLLADKTWNPIKSPVPLDPKKAFDLAYPWASKISMSKPWLVRIELLSLASFTHDWNRFDGHYFYVVEFACDGGIRGFTRSAVVLLDGTFIEPKVKPVP